MRNLQRRRKIKMEMNFLPNSYVPCDECGGRRYREEILKLKWNGKSIADILDLTFEEASSFFEFDHFLQSTFSLMVETGLGYLKLGQPSPTLSGGEAQRLKLAAELATGIDKGKHGTRAVKKPNLPRSGGTHHRAPPDRHSKTHSLASPSG